MRGRAVNQFTGYLREWLTVSWLSLRIHEITSRFEGKTTPPPPYLIFGVLPSFFSNCFYLSFLVDIAPVRWSLRAQMRDPKKSEDLSRFPDFRVLRLHNEPRTHRQQCRPEYLVSALSHLVHPQPLSEISTSRLLSINPLHQISYPRQKPPTLCTTHSPSRHRNIRHPQLPPNTIFKTATARNPSPCPAIPPTASVRENPASQVGKSMPCKMM